MGLFDGLKNQSRKPKDQEGNAAESEQIGYNPENAPVIERDPNVSRETSVVSSTQEDLQADAYANEPAPSEAVYLSLIHIFRTSRAAPARFEKESAFRFGL